MPDPAAEEPAGDAVPAPEPANSTESTQTLLKPEFLVSADEAPAAASAPLPEAPQVLDVDPEAVLTLEDGFEVDRMLSAPPPAASQPAPAPRAAPVEEDTLTLLPDSAEATPAAPVARPAPAAASPVKSEATASPAAPALVPLARRASLTAAAKKLAAASTAAPPSAVQPSKPAAPAAPIAPAAPVAPVRPRAAPAGGSASVTPIAKPPAAPAVPASPPPGEAPSLASWANARAAAARGASPPAPRPSIPVAKAAPPPQAQQPAAAPARPAPAPATAPAAAPAPTAARGMDRDFIARNQVVERYLSGKLPIKAATDFERYCKEHPELLDELGLPDRVNAGLRLLEASGKPEPWQEASRPIWQQPAAILTVAGLAAALAVVLSIVVAGSAGKSHKILELQRQVVERTLDAATSTRIIRLMPNRSGASNTPAIVIGGGEAQLVDFRIDETRSPYKDFRVTIDRLDQGRVMVIDNLTKDSNGHLRVAVNSSAFGPGNYLLTIEGLTLRLEPQPDSWATIGVAQR